MFPIWNKVFLSTAWFFTIKLTNISFSSTQYNMNKLYAIENTTENPITLHYVQQDSLLFFYFIAKSQNVKIEETGAKRARLLFSWQYLPSVLKYYHVHFYINTVIIYVSISWRIICDKISNYEEQIQMKKESFCPVSLRAGGETIQALVWDGTLSLLIIFYWQR